MLKDETVLVTGAAGKLGRLTREILHGKTAGLRLTDIAPMAAARAGETLVPCDLADAQAVRRLLEGVDRVVHLGASLNEDDWGETLRVNIDGSFNLYEAARQAGVRRIVYASSHHVIGMYPVGQSLGLDAPLRPDSLYGLSKCFGENLAQYYWDKFGIESVCLRIGSARPVPGEPRELSTWLSEPDYERLLLSSLQAPAVECQAVYGVSANTASWWSNAQAQGLGYVPRDNAADYAQALPAAGPRHALQGGKRADHRRGRDGQEPTP